MLQFPSIIAVSGLLAASTAAQGDIVFGHITSSDELLGIGNWIEPQRVRHVR